ncbi:BLUF domain-containing protein [Mucilaginibacter litoreus]|uniref:BLUF domain-containing protein n=1 Tax=Mucilaginibacter litoreus TaxID=1048221 RepID=A0ABW3AST3_9SPHI
MYMSKATHKPTQQHLDDILKISVDNNKQKNITGMLLYVSEKNETQNGRFIQVLEGEEKVVRESFEKIRMDVRHTSVVELFTYSINDRNFPDWSMGYKRIESEDLPADLKEWFDPDNFPNNKAKGIINVPLTYLKSFNQLYKQLK